MSTNICRLIKQLMREKGIKQKDLASELSVTFQRVSTILKQDNIEVDNAKRILEVLGCELIVSDKETGESYQL